MDTFNKEQKYLEVDNIEDEIYYRDVIGCAAKKDETGNCATYNCGQGEVRVCSENAVDEEFCFAEEVNNNNQYPDYC